VSGSQHVASRHHLQATSLSCLTCPTIHLTSRTSPRCGTVNPSVVPSKQATRSETPGTMPPQCSHINAASVLRFRFFFFGGGFAFDSQPSFEESGSLGRQQYSRVVRPGRVFRRGHPSQTGPVGL
jgi:hypothetical protein